MSTSLADFYAQMQPYLMGQQSLRHTREVLGASPSGDDNFAFYRTLVERNFFRILGDIFGPLRTLVMREGSIAWDTLVREYATAHPPHGFHPSCLGEAFAEFLGECRERASEQPVLYEEIADFCWIRRQVYTAPEGEGEGFERRLFVRQYTHRVHDIVAALERDSSAPIPAPEPLVLLVYRHHQTLQTRLFQPSLAGIVAVARRQGAELPAAMQGVNDAEVDIADAQLVTHGVFAPRDG